MRRNFRAILTENISYKLVSLFIALILWITILGRRDFIVAKNIEVELIPPAGHSVVYQSVDQIRVKVSGPRTALRRFVETGVSQIVTLDLSNRGVGRFEVEIPRGRVDVPFGVKLVSVAPEKIEVEVVKK